MPALIACRHAKLALAVTLESWAPPIPLCRLVRTVSMFVSVPLSFRTFLMSAQRVMFKLCLTTYECRSTVEGPRKKRPQKNRPQVEKRSTDFWSTGKKCPRSKHSQTYRIGKKVHKRRKKGPRINVLCLSLWHAFPRCMHRITVTTWAEIVKFKLQSVQVSAVELLIRWL